MRAYIIFLQLYRWLVQRPLFHDTNRSGMGTSDTHLSFIWLIALFIVFRGFLSALKKLLWLCLNDLLFSVSLFVSIYRSSWRHFLDFLNLLFQQLRFLYVWINYQINSGFSRSCISNCHIWPSSLIEPASFMFLWMRHLLFLKNKLLCISVTLLEAFSLALRFPIFLL